MAKKKESILTVKLEYEQANAIMQAVLTQAMHDAQLDIRSHPDFAGPEAVAFVKAAKTVLDWWKVPK